MTPFSGLVRIPQQEYRLAKSGSELRGAREAHCLESVQFIQARGDIQGAALPMIFNASHADLRVPEPSDCGAVAFSNIQILFKVCIATACRQSLLS